MPSETRRQLEEWLKTIEVRGGRVLDVGGSQYPVSKDRLKIFKPDEYKILDLPEPHGCVRKPDIAQDLNNDLPFFIPDDHPTGPWKMKWANGDVTDLVSFDVAFCLEVSEYWWNPIQALHNIWSFLSTDGILYISFSFIYPVHSPVEQDYLRYTPRGAEKLLEDAGFKILEMRPRLESENSLIKAAFTVEEMRPAAGYNRHNWVGCLVKCRKI